MTCKVCERCGKTIPDDGHESCPHCGWEPSDNMPDLKKKTPSEMKNLLKENNGVLLNIFEEYVRNHPDVSEDEVLTACRAEILERMSIFKTEATE